MPALIDYFVTEPIDAATRAAFAAYPWCTAILSDPSYIPVQTFHQHPRPGIPLAYMSATLRIPDALIAIQSLYLPPSTSSKSSDLRISPASHESYQPLGTLDGELHTLYVLGCGLSGHKDVAHGGLIATLLDQQTGSLLIADPALTQPRTAFCHVQYVRAVRVPSAVRVRAWKTKVDGRKHWLKAEIEGEEGVLASAEMMFLSGKARL